MAAETDDAFRQLTDAELAVLGPLGVRRAVSAGEYLYRQGDAGYDFYVVLAGAVEIVVNTDGQERVIAATRPPIPRRAESLHFSSVVAPRRRPLLSEVERRTIEQVLSESEGNKSRAARRLGITRTQLYGRLRKYGLETAPETMSRPHAQR